MSKWGKIALKYGIACLAGGLFTALYLINNLKLAETQADTYKMWCDAFTVPGVILIMLFFLVWISDKGTFDGISYALRYAISALIPLGRLKEHKKYYDYVSEREEKRAQRKGHGYLFLLVTGLAFMAVSVVFLILFNRTYNNPG